MSILTMVETKKAVTPVMTSRRNTTPQRHFELPRQVNPAADGGAFDTTPVELGFGYDFGRIPVQAPSLAIGNRVAQRAAQSCPLAASPRACPFGGACHTCPVQAQAKLAISQPDDIYEQEADRIADQIIRMPDPAVDGSQPEMAVVPLQTKRYLQRSAEDVPEIDDHLKSRLNQSRGGSPLPDEVRAFMEPRFGFDFSQVRVHAGGEAARLNRELVAQAFTRGSAIYFAAGNYEPTSVPGRHLLAHELTHVVQQIGGVQAQRLSRPSAVQMKCASCEAEEEIQRSIDISSAPEIVQRQEEAAEEEGGYTPAEPEGGYMPAGAAAEAPSPEPEAPSPEPLDKVRPQPGHCSTFLRPGGPAGMVGRGGISVLSFGAGTSIGILLENLAPYSTTVELTNLSTMASSTVIIGPGFLLGPSTPVSYIFPSVRGCVPIRWNIKIKASASKTVAPPSPLPSLTIPLPVRVSYEVSSNSFPGEGQCCN